MTADRLFALFSIYGWLIIFGICYCEYLNLPGFPAGILMPAIGVLVQQSGLSPAIAVLVSIAAGIAGSLTIYGVCYFGGAPLLKRLFERHPRFNEFVERCHAYIEKHKGWGLFLCRLIPVLRTIVSIPAGLLRVPIGRFTGYSLAGITVWNTALILSGYFGISLFMLS